MRQRVAVLVCAICAAVAAVAAAGQSEKIYTQADGVVMPVPTTTAKPEYTPAAMQARIEGTVLLEMVVRTDGTPDQLRVVKPLDAALDEEAMKAARLWRFTPGQLDGRPVPVRVAMEMTFTLRETPRKAGDPGLIMPVPVTEVRPGYSADALARGVEGNVTVQIVVLPDGTVANPTVVSSLDRDLDRASIEAARQWRFRPGTQDGRAVPVQVSLDFSFSVR